MAICKTKTDTVIKPPEWAENQPAWLRLEDQLTWYDRKSGCAQRWYKWLKFIQVVLAISIPIVSQIDNEGKWLASIAGGLIAIIEAIHHMNQYSTLWITYRSTAERLKHENFYFFQRQAHIVHLQRQSVLLHLRSVLRNMYLLSMRTGLTKRAV